MKAVIRYIIFLFFISVSCNQKKELKAADWISFVEKESNGYRKSITTGELTYTFQYKPASYTALKELNATDGDTKVVLKNRAEALKGTVWFNVYIKNKKGNINPLKSNISGLDEYNSRLNYFLMNAGNDFTMRYGGEEMDKIGYSFENNYGLSPADAMVIGFRIPDSIPVKEVVLEYEDKLYKNGILKINISDKILKNIPNLKI